MDLGRHQKDILDVIYQTHPYASPDGCVKEHRLIFEEYMTKKWGYKIFNSSESRMSSYKRQ